MAVLKQQPELVHSGSRVQSGPPGTHQKHDAASNLSATGHANSGGSSTRSDHELDSVTIVDQAGEDTPHPAKATAAELEDDAIIKMAEATDLEYEVGGSRLSWYVSWPVKFPICIRLCYAIQY